MSPVDEMIPLDEAFLRLDSALEDTFGGQVEAEEVPVRQAVGRVLADDVHSRLDLPPFDKSAMDGFAVVADDEREQYRVIDTVQAGTSSAVALEPGAAVKIMTGAPVPAGGGRVIMVEHTRQEGDTLFVQRHGGPTNICSKAEDVRQGDLIFGAGTTVTPLHMSNLVGCGVTRVPVRRRMRLGILSTGDEIVDDPADLGPGMIMNSSGPLLAALAQTYGMSVDVNRIVQDDLASLMASIDEALPLVDLLLLTGGVSMGEYDYVPEALERKGLTTHFTRVAMKPGKPSTMATGAGKIVMGLPGNPVSTYLAFHLFALRVMAYLTGAPSFTRDVQLSLARDFSRKKGERLEYIPCRLDEQGRCAELDYHGSAHLTGLTQAEGFFIVPRGTTSLPAGATVTFVWHRGLS